MSGTKLQGIELLRALCLAFGPSSCEDNVADLIEQQLEGVCELRRNRMNHVIAHLPGTGENLPRIQLSAHMDEVGMMITSIDDNGFLRFSTIGGIDNRVICGRKVQVGTEISRIPGVIGAKAIHLQSSDERSQATPSDKLYIDIGANSREEAEKYVDIGDYATFDSDFVIFGENGRRMRSKAIDDRLGCAAIVEVIRALAEVDERPFDLWCAFTGREEIGKSGAKVAAFEIRPDYAIILEATAIADMPDVPANSRVSDVGCGGTISIA
ncbi:MAG: M42 family peptidase, partial [Clostridia bacterium]|nr:M42 family peptidase [Clostridia bacterium]